VKKYLKNNGQYLFENNGQIFFKKLKCKITAFSLWKNAPKVVYNKH